MSKISFEEFKNLAKEVDQFFFERSGASEEMQMFYGLAKVQEELGEVSEAVLSICGHQRSTKAKLTKDDLNKEVADVLLACLCLCNRAGVDIQDGMTKVHDKIKGRLEKKDA
jgi:NTP pyrophosphatase (non-canonical NTP hydrolase)